MPKSKVTVPHALGREQALDRVQGLMPQIREQFQGQVSDFEETWEANVLLFRFKTFGMKIQGRMEVEDDQVTVEQDLPLAALMVKGQVESTIRTELGKLLA